MAKQFFDVFPTLKLDKKMQNLFEQVLVEKVSATKGRDFIRVTVTCEYLIPKETVFRVEKEIKKQFFATHNVTVKLYERFRLSEQYTPRKLMDLYKESILLELRDHSPIEYSIFKGAVIDFPKEDELKLTIEDTVLARSKAAELSRILEKIFNERCGFSIACQMEYEEKEEGRLREEDDEKIARQIAQIAARAKGAGGGEGAYGQGSGETVLGVGVPGAVERNSGNAPQKDKKALSAPDLGKGQPDRTGQGSVTPFPGEKKGLRKGDFGKGGKGDFRRAVRRSDNPDVLYGRDFDEEASPIEDIIGEIGEVVIRGKIISFDTREIKNERTILMFDVTDFTDTMTIKMFAHNEQVAEIKEGIRPG